MSIAEKLQTIAENEQRVYEAGKQAEWSAFWDSYQDYGNRTSYNSAFFNLGWNQACFNPKYDFICSSSASMFSGSRIVEINKNIDISNSRNVGTMFYEARYLKTVSNLIVSENNDLSGLVFAYCDALENLTISGTIGKNMDVHWSNKLTHESLMSIINHLKDGVSELTLTIGATNLAKLTDAEKAIATTKGWTLA